MDELYIPNTKNLSTVTKETVDRFTSWAEALSVPVLGRITQVKSSKMAVARVVMMKLSRQTSDTDGLFDILGRLVLTVVSNCLKCPLRSTEPLPPLTRSQRYAMKEFLTFDHKYVQRLNKKIRLLTSTVLQHKQALVKVQKCQEECWTHEKSITDLKLALKSVETETAHMYMRNEMTEKDMDIRKNDMKFLHRKLSRKQQCLTDAEHEYDKAVGKETAVRDKMKMIADDVTRDTKYEIVDRLTFGMKCVREIIGELPGYLQDKAADLIKDVNIENTAENLMRISSKKYHFATLPDFVNINGFESKIPMGKIIDPNVRKTLSEEDMWRERGVTLVSSFVCGAGSSDADSSDTDTGYGSNGSHTTTDLGGYVQRPLEKGYVITTQPWQREMPGFLYLNTGTKIKQKVHFEEEEIAFGWYRSRSWYAKNWGFYFKHVTTPCLTRDNSLSSL